VSSHLATILKIFFMAYKLQTTKSGKVFLRGPFAVTGHLNLHPDNLIKLRSTLYSLLSRIANSLPLRKPALISGLAEGADLLVAEEALRAGWFVDAALALPVDELIDDYSIEGRDCFFRLLRLCRNVVVVSEAHVLRPDCYVRISEYLREVAFSLFAVWDGFASDLPGGTADTIRIFTQPMEFLPEHYDERWGLEIGDMRDRCLAGINCFQIDQQRTLIHIPARRL